MSALISAYEYSNARNIVNRTFLLLILNKISRFFDPKDEYFGYISALHEENRHSEKESRSRLGSRPVNH
jgi:hypothetical protein